MFVFNKNNSNSSNIYINKIPPLLHNKDNKNNKNNKDAIDLRDPGIQKREAEQNNQINKLYYSDQLDPVIVGNLYETYNNKKPIYTQRTSYGAPVWETQEISKFGKVGYTAPRGLSEYNSANYYKNVGVTNNIWRDGHLTNETYEQAMNDLNSFDADLYNNVATGDNLINEIQRQRAFADDGVPQNWNLPSTPLLSYAIKKDECPTEYGEYLKYSIEPKEDYFGVEGPTPYIPNGINNIFIPDHDPKIG